MAHTKKKVFDGLYAQLEETDGNVVLFSAKGEPSVIFEMTNPVQQLCTDAGEYLLFQDVLSNVVQTLGEGYALPDIIDIDGIRISRSRTSSASKPTTMRCRKMRSS